MGVGVGGGGWRGDINKEMYLVFNAQSTMTIISGEE